MLQKAKMLVAERGSMGIVQRIRSTFSKSSTRYIGE